MVATDRPSPASPVRRVLRPVRGRLAIAMLLQACSAVLVLAPLVGVGELGRVLLDPAADPAQARRIVLLSAIGLAAGFALRGTAELLAELSDNALALRLRRDAADALTRAPALGGGRSAEHVQTVMHDDVTTMHHLVAHAAPDVVRAAATTLAVGAYLTWTAWELAAILVPPIASYLWLYRRMMAGSVEKMVTYGQALRDISDAVGSFTQGIAVVKRYGGVDRAHDAYRDASRRFTAFFLGWARPFVVPETISMALVAPVTLMLLVVGVGAGLLAAGRLDGIDVLPAVVLVPSLSAPLASLTTSVRTLQLGRGAAERVVALLDLPPLQEPSDPATPDGGLTFDRVHFAYDERRPVLQDISVTFEPGTVTAIVGPSGSGKSTLAGLAMRLADPDRGSVRLGGVPLDRVAASERARRITAVFQDVQLLRATVRDNLVLGRPEATDDEVVAAATAAQIHDRIVELPDGYDTVVGDGIDLSGGEAQRLSIARALLVDPQVLLLDEPTSAADPHAQQAIQRAFAAVLARRERHQVVIVVAHRMETIRGADRVVVLDDGRVVQQGSHDELVATAGRYQQLWHAQHADRIGEGTSS